MKSLSAIFFTCAFSLAPILINDLTAQVWTITERAEMPEAISNNAVESAVVNGKKYIYSFGGLDSTKTANGIHLRSYRYDVEGDRWESISQLPDNRGKIAAAASRIGDIIYIVGGYYVFESGSEISSNRVHRYDVQSNTYLSNAQNIPVAIDDHVQAVWRDSLIYVITGWSNSTNVRDVQIYVPDRDQWSTATSVPSGNVFPSFGASGNIVGDTIFYFGGAAIGSSFPIQNEYRKGVINPDDPYEIDWTSGVFSPDQEGYRMGSLLHGDTICWIGGSETTYNFNGIAYNGSGGVEPSMKSMYYVPASDELFISEQPELPMDLRGVANLGDSLYFIAGGIETGQKVSKKMLALKWNGDFSVATSQASRSKNKYELRPSITTDILSLYRLEAEDHDDHAFYIVSSTGVNVQNGTISANGKIDISQLRAGQYFIVLISSETHQVLRFSKW